MQENQPRKSQKLVEECHNLQSSLDFLGTMHRFHTTKSGLPNLFKCFTGNTIKKHKKIQIIINGKNDEI